MAVDMNAAMNAYGVTANLVNAIPELRGILSDAVRDGRSIDWVNAQVAVTPWYQQHGQRMRDLLMQAATDPAEYQQQLENAQNHVKLMAEGMGRTPDVNTLAYQYLAYGWDDQTLQQQISIFSGFSTTPEGTLVGTAAQYTDHLKEVAQSYGVPYTDSFINEYASRIQAGFDSPDGFDALMRARAKAAFPQFAAQIDAGQTIAQVADPYMATYAKTLEVPQTSVTLNDPLIKKALSSTAQDGATQQAMPLYQFEQQLKNDPRYDKTDQARTDAYSTLAQVGKDFGFVQ